MLRDWIKKKLARYSTAFLIWAVVTCVMAVVVAAMVSKLFLGGHLLTRQAIEVGQQAIVHIASGEVDGNVRHTKRSATSDTIISKEGLAPAPLVSITEQSDKGLIPVTGHDGTMPWKYYARPYTTKEKHPTVAVILTDMGLSKRETEDAFTLPHTFTLSFSPYASDAKEWSRKAREEGFESLVDLPMQPDDYPVSDAGPYGLLSELSATESSARLHWILSRFPGFVGAVAPINEKMTQDINVIRPTVVELSARGILFIYVKSSFNASLAELSKSRGLYTVGIDTVIDKDITQPAIEEQLQTLLDTAKTQGYAVGIAHGYPPTIATLNEWADTLAAQGVELVPVSAIAARLQP